MTAHDYETDYALVAEHFNELHALLPLLVKAAARLQRICAQSLGIGPATRDFKVEFSQVCDFFEA